MADIAIILDNAGNDVYAQTSRDFLTSPVRADLMRVLLDNESQLNNVVKIRNFKSVGTQSNRDISLRQFISAKNPTNLIIDVPLNPPVILDGQTSFRIVIEANSTINLMFYFDQAEIGDLLK